MGPLSHRFLALVALGVTLAGCAQKRAQPVGAAPPPPRPVASAMPAPAATAEEDREKRPRLGEAAVYVDGRPSGVLRITELPATLKPRVIKLAGGYETKHYDFFAYARALGIEPSRLRALHLYGGSRIVVVDKDELGRIGDRLSFSFVQGDRGKPRVHWPPVKLRVNTTIDMLSNVAFYVDKAPPTLVSGELVMPDGTRVEGKVPYAAEEQGNGTRVYVDGALVGMVKRKKLTNDLLVPGEPDGADRFSLLAYAEKLRGGASKARAIDLVAGDDVVARLEPEAARKVSFQVPARNRGQALVAVPTADGARPARISAVQIFVKGAPPERALTPLDEAFEAAPASNRAGGPADDD